MESVCSLNSDMKELMTSATPEEKLIGRVTKKGPLHIM